MTVPYHITVKTIANKEEAMSIVHSSVTNRLPKRPKSFIADCDKVQLDALVDSGLVQKIEPLNPNVSVVAEEQAVKTVNYIRRQPIGDDDDDYDGTYGYTYGTDDGKAPLGNWGLLRHTNPVNDLSVNVGSTGTYTAPSYNGTALDGSGVDLILNIGSIVHPDDPEFKTDGVSRVVPFQWNTLPLRYAEDIEGHSKGDLILGDGQTQQFNTEVPTIAYSDAGLSFTITDSEFDFVNDTIRVASGTGIFSVGDRLNFSTADSASLVQGNLYSSLQYYVHSIFPTTNKIRVKRVTSESTSGNFTNLSYLVAQDGNNVIMTLNQSTVESSIDDHGEAVAYLACSNTYGWATGANIYIWPRDQLGGFSSIYENGWDSFRLFHQNKVAQGITRPTIVVDSVGSRYTADFRYDSMCTGILFRDNIYTEIAPGGAPDVSVVGYNSEASHSATGAVFGNTNTRQYSGEVSIGRYYYFDENNNLAYNELARTEKTSLPMTEQESDELLEIIGNGHTNSDIYESRIQPLEYMMSCGVHHVSAVGNYRTCVALPGGPDFNNGQFKPYIYDINSLGDFTYFNRKNHYCTGDTITVGALAGFYRSDQFNGDETFAEFSCRGEGVDCVAAGQSIYIDLFHNGRYRANGTSFSSPNIAGMACLVLQIYPTSTVRQLRRFFRFHAVGTDKLYESGTQPIKGSKFGDPAFFNDAFGNRGYSGNIAYLDVNANNWTDPRTLSDLPIVSSMSLLDNKIDFTIAQINSKLATVGTE